MNKYYGEWKIEGFMNVYAYIFKIFVNLILVLRVFRIFLISPHIQ